MNFNLTAYELALIAGGFTTTGAMLGNWISHRFSDHRDRRKERNEVSEPLAEILRKERSHPTPGSKIDLEPFRRVLNSISRLDLRRFNNAVEEYEKAKEEQKHNVGSLSDFCLEGDGRFSVPTYYYHDDTSIKAALDKLLKFTERK